MLLYNIIFFYTTQILDENTLIKLKSQKCLKVFNLVMANSTKFALEETLILQFVYIILLWLYSLSTIFTYFIKYLNNNQHN